jgi:hypothetical protein
MKSHDHSRPMTIRHPVMLRRGISARVPEMRPPVLAVTVLVPFIAACAGETRTMGDNGVPNWSVSPEPVVEIGIEGDPRYEFYWVVGVATLSGGGVVVADGGSQELRVFGASGEFLRTFGGKGDGPGEFRNLSGINVRDDSIIVMEGMFGPARVHVFDTEEGFQWGASLRPDGAASGVTAMAILSTNALVVTSGAGPRAATPPPDGVVKRDTLTLGILQIHPSQVVSWIGDFPNRSWFSYAMPPGAFLDRGIAVHSLGPSLVLGASDDAVWIGDSGTGMISIFDASGSLVTEIPFPVPARPFDEATLRDARTAELAAVPDLDPVGRRAGIEALYSSRMRPPTAPLFTRFTAGPAGEMWIEQFSEVPKAEHGVVVLDRTGREIGRATIPAGLTLHTVDHNRVIGVRADADGVERIVVHRLVR